MPFEPLLIDARNPGPMTGEGNHTYLLIGPDGGAALIDAGPGEPVHLHALEQALRERRAQLRQVFVTHAHADHAAGAPLLASAHPGVRFYKHVWPEADQRFAVEWRHLGDGERLTAGGEPLDVLHTPGHSPDHLVFWHAPTRTAFTGDLVVQGSSVMIQASQGGSLGDYLASLRRLLALAPQRLLPAHGPEVTSPAGLLTQYLEHRLQREEQVLEALRAGRATVQDIADYIYDGLTPALLPAAHENVTAHLDKLRIEGRARTSGAGRWSP